MKYDIQLKKLEKMLDELHEFGLPLKSSVDMAKEFETIYKATNDIRAKSLNKMFLARSEAEMGNLNKCYEIANENLPIAQEANEYWCIFNIYNLLGYVNSANHNILTAFDCIWRAMQVVKRANPKDTKSISTAYMNIACCLILADGYMEAVEYLEKVDVLYNEMNTNTDINLRNKINLCTNKVICYYHLKEYEKTRYTLNRWKELENKNITGKYMRSQREIWEYLILIHENKNSDAVKVLESLLGDGFTKDATEQLLQLGEIVAEHKDYNVLHKILKKIEEIYVTFENINYEKKYIALKIKYYEGINDLENYRKNCGDYFNIQQKNEEAEKKSYRISLKTYISVGEMQEEQERLVQSHKVLKEKSELDELTGLFNRYKLNEFCDKEFEKAKKIGNNISVIIIDIDYFKRLNDTYGHVEGDKCLKLVASNIKETIGKNSIAARYGGDEFVVVKNNCDEEELRNIMVKLQKNIEKLKILNINSPLNGIITISQGAVSKIPKCDDNFLTFIELADKALYEAKAISRNALCIK